MWRIWQKVPRFRISALPAQIQRQTINVFSSKSGTLILQIVAFFLTCTVDYSAPFTNCCPKLCNFFLLFYVSLSFLLFLHSFLISLVLYTHFLFLSPSFTPPSIPLSLTYTLPSSLPPSLPLHPQSHTHSLTHTLHLSLSPSLPPSLPLSLPPSIPRTPSHPPTHSLTPSLLPSLPPYPSTSVHLMLPVEHMSTQPARTNSIRCNQV